jgi:hypothetical protein
MRVYAAFEMQSVVKGKIVEASIYIFGNSPIDEMHSISFKRARDNNIIHFYLNVVREDREDEDDRYGAPCINFWAPVAHDSDQLANAVVSMFGGSVRVHPARQDSRNYAWEDIEKTDQAWANRIPKGRATQIRLVDTMSERGVVLLQSLGSADGNSLLQFRDVLADVTPVSEFEAGTPEELLKIEI